ncbi:MAG: S9 family peptidase [Acidobacteria bacterium]|nr:S9 family peptidase [Acidobacteriota bacterium]
MKIKSTLLAFAVSASLATAAFAQQPPLIDREIFFGNPEIAGASLSPDGKYIMIRKPYKGTMNIWVVKSEEPFDKARLITNRTDRPIAGSFWSRDSKYILFTQDNDKAWHDVYKVKISTGERTLVTENKDRYQGVVFDNADKLRLAIRSAQNGDTEILRIDDGGKATKIFSCDVFESCGTIRFHKDNNRVYIRTNKGSNDLIELALLDVATGKVEKVESDPMNKVDLDGANFSDLTDELIVTAYEDDRERLYFKNKEFQKDYEWIKKKVGDRDISFGSSTRDEMMWIVSTNSDVDPGTVWLFDRKNKNLKELYKVRQNLDRAALSPMKAVRYKSSDGLEVPAYLTIPKGSTGKNLPVVMYIHGGPWGRDYWGYHSYAQFLANRGYAVLQPNFRASTGYGKKFLNAGNNEWGQKMQDDITWGVKYLIEQGIADPKRVGIMGGSYGGYATLAGVTYTPDVYAAAVAIVAPSNLQTLLEAIPPYWEAIRTVFYKRMGDPNTPEGLAQMKRQSPLTYADRIKTPLLVVQGANDPRVNKRESDQIVIALRDRKYPVEYLVAPDEGHGFARPVNNMAMVLTAEKFLAKHLGGRYQESAGPDVAKRLVEITVDPTTVSLVKKAEMNAAPVGNLTGKWTMIVDTGREQLEVALDLKQTGSDFAGSMSSPVGNGTVEKGKMNGTSVTSIIRADVNGQAMEIQMDGKLEGDKMSGTLAGAGIPGFTFTAKRNK